ncbi:biotinidase-like [Protopterus annectens]|uniref:biotinidase-like n=1 Tax=Protopterus annectens TaxID=7888 RepID=UPI001CFB1104|nr:biotinidase-like [Protopterus annectens]XP_043922777.1 biotinidase-like [Protopterus annectens]XP_043922778.1 biotinidase-like [Protopterus annectens]
MMTRRHLMSVFLLFCGTTFVFIHGKQYYTAAVYEHSSILNPDTHAIIDRESALKLMNKNLDIYEKQITLSAEKGVQIIVFPEDGIHGFNYTRESIYPFLETVPDPDKIKWNPCQDPHAFIRAEVLTRLSCMARKGRMYVVANMPTREDCDDSDPNCPRDGRYQFNTNVVFSDNGDLVARYRKQNLFFEYEFNTPSKAEHAIFDTPFAGKFGMFICYDLLFYEPAVSLIEKYNVTQILFPTAWMSAFPFLVGIQFQRAFASAFGINFLVANLHHPSLNMTSSGIYTPKESFYHYDMIGDAGKLIVARIPVVPTDRVQSEAHFVPTSQQVLEKCNSTLVCSAKKSLGLDSVCEDAAADVLTENSMIPPTFNSIIFHDNFTLSPLTTPVGEQLVCSNSLCCHVSFCGNFSHSELYVLGAFDGLHAGGAFYTQVCALLKCADTNYDSCGAKVTNASSTIDFKLWGNFSTRHIYPEILGSGLTLYLPDSMGWENKSYYMYRRSMSLGLTTAALYGRWYEKD